MRHLRALIALCGVVSVAVAACAGAATQPTTTSTPTAAVTAAPTAPVVTPSPTQGLADSPVPAGLVGVDYVETTSGATFLHVYPVGDPACSSLGVSDACFKIGVSANRADPGGQGPAALVDGLLALRTTKCPFCEPAEIGITQFFEIREGGELLYGLRCEPAAGPCPDAGLTYRRAG
jgi:hypothetical protein